MEGHTSGSAGPLLPILATLLTSESSSMLNVVEEALVKVK